MPTLPRRHDVRLQISDARGHTIPAISDICLAALFSGFAISFVVAPMEGLKARLQVNYSAGIPTTAIAQARATISTLGATGLYRGWAPTALSRMSNYAYFGPYEYFRRTISTALGSMNPDGTVKR